ncbi:MAG: T9SS type A sorting domain-containing protein, partial [Bacteroidales bacterium]
NTTNKTIDISALNKGIYIIELKTEKGVIHRKFIKE